MAEHPVDSVLFPKGRDRDLQAYFDHVRATWNQLQTTELFPALEPLYAKAKAAHFIQLVVNKTSRWSDFEIDNSNPDTLLKTYQPMLISGKGHIWFKVELEIEKEKVVFASVEITSPSDEFGMIVESAVARTDEPPYLRYEIFPYNQDNIEKIQVDNKGAPSYIDKVISRLPIEN